MLIANEKYTQCEWKTSQKILFFSIFQRVCGQYLLKMFNMFQPGDGMQEFFFDYKLKADKHLLKLNNIWTLCQFLEFDPKIKQLSVWNKRKTKFLEFEQKIGVYTKRKFSLSKFGRKNIVQFKYTRARMDIVSHSKNLHDDKLRFTIKQKWG